MKVNIEAPELVAALNAFVAAIQSGELPIPVPAVPAQQTAPMQPVTPPPAAVPPAYQQPANPTPPAAFPTAQPPAQPQYQQPPTVPPAPATVPTAPNPASPSNPQQPPAAAPTYTLEQLARAGAALAQAGKMEDALALLGRYGVQTVNQLKPEQYGPFATELRALGAQV
jgi:hypothetical protein